MDKNQAKAKTSKNIKITQTHYNKCPLI